MWSVGSRSLDLFLGAQEIAITLPDGQVVWHPVADGRAGVAKLEDAVRSAYGKHAVRSRVWLSGACARPFLVGPLEGLRSWDEAVSIAAALAPEATGLMPPCLAWVDGPVHRAATVATATEAEPMKALRESTVLQPVSIAPWWSAAFNWALQKAPSPLIVVSDQESLITLGGRGGEFTGADATCPAPAADELEAWLKHLSTARGVRRTRITLVGIERTGTRGIAAQSVVPFGASLGSL